MLVRNDLLLEDFESLESYHTKHFSLKNTLCYRWCSSNSVDNLNANNYVRVYEKYSKEYFNKLEH